MFDQLNHDFDFDILKPRSQLPRRRSHYAHFRTRMSRWVRCAICKETFLIRFRGDLHPLDPELDIKLYLWIYPYPFGVVFPSRLKNHISFLTLAASKFFLINLFIYVYVCVYLLILVGVFS